MMKEDLIAALVGITFFCVITIPLLFFTGYLDFRTDGGAEVPIPITPSDSYASDETATLLIRTALSGQGIRGVTTQVADGREKGGTKNLILGYRSTALTVNELEAETGYILGVYLGAAGGGWDIDELSVVVGDVNGNAIGMWYCTKDWTSDYINGKISIEGVSLKVISSMTTF